MVPFDFQPRTRIVFGQGAAGRLGQLARELNFHRTLLVADAGLVRAGHVAEALRWLEEAGISAVPYHDFGENPDSAMIEAGCRFAEPLELDSIVGLGGGSSLDCAERESIRRIFPSSRERRSRSSVKSIRDERRDGCPPRHGSNRASA